MAIRPDWRNAEAYASLLVDGNSWIAWEFLVRNPEYLQDVEAYEADIAAWVRDQAGTPEYKAITDYMGEPGFWSMQIWDFEADKMKLSRGPDGWYTRNEKWRKHFRDRWQLPRIHRPHYLGRRGEVCIDFDGDAFACFFHTSDEEIERYKLPGPRLLREGVQVLGPHVLLPVDLSLPLDELERIATWMIRHLRDKGIQQGTVKVRKSRVLAPSVYVEQLRILDGVEAGATFAEIGEVLHPGAINGPEDRQRDKRIRAAHKAALKMRAEGWRVLAGVPE